MVRAVLFDLDDTLFDHRQCARMALTELHHAHTCFHGTAFGDFERIHAVLLEDLHRRVMMGEVPLDLARKERFRRLFHAVGVSPDDDTVTAAARAYREGYLRVRQPVAGAARLLGLVKERALVGIVSNNLLEEQQDKLRHCRLDGYVDALVVSEEAGMSKPDPEIFSIALRRLGCTAAEAVMVGDSWAADIVGAHAAGIRPVWFNPDGKPSPDPDADIEELRTLEPAEDAIALIFADPDE